MARPPAPMAPVIRALSGGCAGRRPARDGALPRVARLRRPARRPRPCCRVTTISDARVASPLPDADAAACSSPPAARAITTATARGCSASTSPSRSNDEAAQPIDPDNLLRVLFEGVREPASRRRSASCRRSRDALDDRQVAELADVDASSLRAGVAHPWSGLDAERRAGPRGDCGVVGAALTPETHRPGLIDVVATLQDVSGFISFSSGPSCGTSASPSLVSAICLGVAGWWGHRTGMGICCLRCGSRWSSACSRSRCRSTTRSSTPACSSTCRRCGRSSS